MLPPRGVFVKLTESQTCAMVRNGVELGGEDKAFGLVQVKEASQRKGVNQQESSKIWIGEMEGHLGIHVLKLDS